MQSIPVIGKQLILLGVVLAALQCAGCGPSGTDAVKFANKHISRLKVQKPKVVQGNNGKWYSEAMEIRNANPGFKQDGQLSPHQAMVSYEFRMLRSAEFDTESEAHEADLSPINEAWESKEELFTFKDGKWKPRE